MLSRADRDALTVILPAIVGHLGSDVFLASELIHAEAAGVRLVLRTWTARRLGRLLKRATGIVVDGFIVERRGTEAGAVLWAVVGVLPS